MWQNQAINKLCPQSHLLKLMFLKFLGAINFITKPVKFLYFETAKLENEHKHNYRIFKHLNIKLWFFTSFSHSNSVWRTKCGILWRTTKNLNQSLMRKRSSKCLADRYIDILKTLRPLIISLPLKKSTGRRMLSKNVASLSLHLGLSFHSVFSSMWLIQTSGTTIRMNPGKPLLITKLQ